MRPFTLNCDQPRHGWFDATASCGEQGVPMSVSYISDGPKDLAWAALAVFRGATADRCAWMDEPGQYRWLFDRSGDRVRVRIREFNDAYSKQSDEQGKPLLDCECDVLRLATQVRGQLQQWLNALGERGYEQAWHHPFPIREHHELTRLIEEYKRARRG